MQKSEFPKMRHHVGLWQIGSQMYHNQLGSIEIVIVIEISHVTHEAVEQSLTSKVISRSSMVLQLLHKVQESLQSLPQRACERLKELVL